MLRLVLVCLVPFAPAKAERIRRRIRLCSLGLRHWDPKGYCPGVCTRAALRAGGGGLLAGAVSKTATAPVEFVRMKMMVGGAKAGGFLEVVAAAWKQNGALGFFNGNLADVIRVTPTKAVQLAAFDVFKRKLSKKDEVRSRPGHARC